MSTIVTKRLILTLGENRLPTFWAMVDWLNDPEVVQYSEQRHRTHTVDTQLNYVYSFKPPSEFRVIYWGEEPIGTITAQVDEINKVADIGIMIGDKQCWGEGFGTEAWVAMMNHLFETGIYKIEAGCMSPNAGMKRIFGKSGMTREGFRDSHFVFRSGRADMEQWAKFNDK